MHAVMWFNLMARLGVKGSDPAANKWYNAMVDIYDGETHRVVHDLGYVRNMLFATDESRYEIGDGDDEAMEIAIWFAHSIHYPDRDPFQNILGSAQLAGEFMKNLEIGDETFRQKVVRLIAIPGLAQTNYPNPFMALYDANHEWMARDPERYKDHLIDLRQEYSVLSNFEFGDMREAELRDIIARGYVFYSDPMQYQNDGAMSNAEAELKIWVDHRKTMLASI